ncbi:hypothetical protein RJ639_041313 [Escallonia herrerae]|uniref:C2H2-type domain-containing protein n=1 Tax=Escallonia herrerae TaxID=1293975 RepID=A0AA88WFB6_9ASTE|nr:hypothetical protein RJ639_041313 [Escallonia herrerae]
MHRRRHKVPWKLVKRSSEEASAAGAGAIRKRVFVCPEPSCLHHDPRHALGDLVGIKKHFRRKHSNHKQWVCQKCSKGYAVQSDYKAHLKTCGTRGHSCDCGRVFSRVESFIEHQDTCNTGRLCPQSETQTWMQQPGACLSRTTSVLSPSVGDINVSPPSAPTPVVKPVDTTLSKSNYSLQHVQHNLELQLLSSSCSTTTSSPAVILPTLEVNDYSKDHDSTNLRLSISSSHHDRQKPISAAASSSERMFRDEESRQQFKLAVAEKAYAEEARQQAKRQIELAEHEFANAKRIRQQAQAELDKAQALRERATKQMKATVEQMTCHACKQHFQYFQAPLAAPDEHSVLALSYMSSTLTEDES